MKNSEKAYNEKVKAGKTACFPMALWLTTHILPPEYDLLFRLIGNKANAPPPHRRWRLSTYGLWRPCGNNFRVPIFLN
jgi:hypothetical protein